MENTKNLSWALFDIALGHGYNAQTLQAAYDSKALDIYDKRVLTRYLEGSQLSTDHLNLQSIAIKLNEVNHG
tara:strand:- start:2062 stop:2277 length:216 start_codon:yes stop_codon:yes gene_type:complete